MMNNTSTAMRVKIAEIEESKNVSSAQRCLSFSEEDNHNVSASLKLELSNEAALKDQKKRGGLIDLGANDYQSYGSD